MLKLTLDAELPTNRSSNNSSDMASEIPSDSSYDMPSGSFDSSSHLPLNMPSDMSCEGMLKAEEVPEESEVEAPVLDEPVLDEPKADKSRAEESENRVEQLRHEKILRRIQRRTKLSIFFLDHAEQLYFWGKLLAAIAFLLLSFALMAGQSYMPFLYNQF